MSVMRLQRATRKFRDAMLPFIDPIVGERALVLSAVNEELKESGFRLVDTVEPIETESPHGGAEMPETLPKTMAGPGGSADAATREDADSSTAGQLFTCSAQPPEPGHPSYRARLREWCENNNSRIGGLILGEVFDDGHVPTVRELERIAECIYNIVTDETLTVTLPRDPVDPHWSRRTFPGGTRGDGG